MGERIAGAAQFLAHGLQFCGFPAAVAELTVGGDHDISGEGFGNGRGLRRDGGKAGKDFLLECGFRGVVDQELVGQIVGNRIGVQPAGSAFLAGVERQHPLRSGGVDQTVGGEQYVVGHHQQAALRVAKMEAQHGLVLAVPVFQDLVRRVVGRGGNGLCQGLLGRNADQDNVKVRVKMVPEVQQGNTPFILPAPGRAFDVAQKDVCRQLFPQPSQLLDCALIGILRQYSLVPFVDVETVVAWRGASGRQAAAEKDLGHSVECGVGDTSDAEGFHGQCSKVEVDHMDGSVPERLA